MIETFVINNKLYTKRANLRNWEYNLKTLSNDKYQDLKKAREEYVDIEPLLVHADGLILGGNSRNAVDSERGEEDAWIELIEFGRNETDNRWYVVNLENGQLRTDKKSFSTQEEAMQAYSILHNAQFGGVDPEKLSQWMGSPLMPEYDWSKAFVTIGDPKSVQAFVDKVAAEPLDFPEFKEDTIQPALEVSQTTSDGPEPANPDALPPEPTPDPKDHVEVKTKCGDCGNEFWISVPKKALDTTTP